MSDYTDQQTVWLMETVEWAERSLRALDRLDETASRYFSFFMRGAADERPAPVPVEVRESAAAFRDAEYMAVMCLGQVAKAWRLVRAFVEVPPFPEADAIERLRGVQEHWEAHDEDHPDRKPWLATWSGKRLAKDFPDVRPDMTAFDIGGVTKIGNLLDMGEVRARVRALLAAVEPSALRAVGVDQRYPDD